MARYNGRSSSLHPDEGRKFLKRLTESREPAFWFIAAVVATFISSALYEILTVPFWRDWPYFFVRLAWAGGLTLLVLILLPRVLAYVERRQRPPTTSGLTELLEVTTPRVLITYVSIKNPRIEFQESHQAAVKYFLDKDKDGTCALKHVLLIHSADTKEAAVDYAGLFEGDKNVRIEFEWQGLETDFYKLESVYRITKSAIDRALLYTDGNVQDVLLDLTGGTKIATSGGLIIGRQREIPLSYIVPKKGLIVLEVDTLSQLPVNRGELIEVAAD